uniref:Uncharacterized protein n=1 Tax=Avena sativa TaxID=4498 RepID=A0ACD5YEX0_AVESA
MNAMPIPEPPMEEGTQLPLDALSLIFAKVGVDVLMGAGLVCRFWLHAARVPDVWRTLHMEMEDNKALRSETTNILRALAKVAVNRSAGQLEAFAGYSFVNNDLLMHIAERSPSLKSLRLNNCWFITDDVFEKVIRNSHLSELRSLELVNINIGNKGLMALLDNAPHLDSLYLWNCFKIDDDNALREKCLRIKNLTLGWDPYDDDMFQEPDLLCLN